MFLRDLWPTPEQIKDTIAEAINEDMYRRTYADVFTGDENWAALPVPEGDLFAWDPDSTYVRLPPYFEGMSPEPGTVEDVAGARCLVMIGDSVTTDHISPARRDQAGEPGRPLPGRARRRAQGLQLLRVASREPRGDGARDVRQRAPPQPARARQRGHVDGAPAGRRGDDDLRGRRALPRRGRPDRRARRQGVRLRLLPRLGGQGTEPARRAGGDRRELRAHPPLEPDRDGDRPAPVPGRRVRGVARPERARDVRRRGARERRGELGAGDRDPGRRRRAGRLHRPRAPRHAARARVPPPRRNPALRAAQDRRLLASICTRAIARVCGKTRIGAGVVPRWRRGPFLRSLS